MAVAPRGDVHAQVGRFFCTGLEALIEREAARKLAKAVKFPAWRQRLLIRRIHARRRLRALAPRHPTQSAPTLPQKSVRHLSRIILPAPLRAVPGGMAQVIR